MPNAPPAVHEALARLLDAERRARRRIEEAEVAAIFIGLAEGIVIYGLIVSFIILGGG
jgi:hypothetical protein